jgi:hypothetical protein
MQQTLDGKGVNATPSKLLSESPPRELKTLRRRDGLEEISARRGIQSQLYHSCDLAQALHDDLRSKNRPDATVKRQLALYRSGQAK